MPTGSAESQGRIARRKAHRTAPERRRLDEEDDPETERGDPTFAYGGDEEQAPAVYDPAAEDDSSKGI